MADHPGTGHVTFHNTGKSKKRRKRNAKSKSRNTLINSITGKKKKKMTQTEAIIARG